MSGNLAYARPLPSPVREEHPRHIEIVTTRAQRKARPRVAYAIVTVGSVFVIFAAQLLLSIVVSDGAYQIQTLQNQQKDLLRTEQSLSETLDLLSSTQHLAANAAGLGMVPNAAPMFLDLETGAIAGAPGTFDRGGCGGTCNLVANALLADVPLTQQSVAGTAGSEAPTTSTVAEQPTQADAIPAPVTH